MSSIRTILKFLIFLPLAAFAASNAPFGEDDIAHTRLPRESLSLYATSGSQILISHNAEKALIPASVTKIVTAAAALHYLEPTSKVTTELMSDAPVENGVLKGDLYIHGGGDPSFVSESMWFLVNEFIRNQITRIDGDIKVDDSLFDSVRFDPARDPVRNDRAYDAPVGAMSMNWNSVNVFVRPGAKVGNPAVVFADPESNYIQVVNNALTVSGGSTEIAVSRRGKPLADSDVVAAGDSLVISGKIGRNAPEKVIYKDISQPDLWSGYNLVSFLKQRGISVQGSVKAAKVPHGALVLAHFDSKPVGLMVQDMMKFSNNFVAEMLTKLIGLKLGDPPATLDKGVNGIKQYLQNLGFKDGAVEIVSPSGFNRKNRVSALTLQKVLGEIKKDFKIYPEFLSALPVNGRDGTLKSRMKTFAQEVRAKTGYMTGIVALAGFVDRGDGDTATFAFIYNGAPERADQAKTLMDRLCEKLTHK